jgi:hypothetical protein
VRRSSWGVFDTPDLAVPAQTSRLLEFDVLVQAQEGNLDRALSSCRAMLNTARSIGDEAQTVSQLWRLGYAITALRKLERVLAQGIPSLDALEAVQRLLEEEAGQPILLIAVRGERAANDHLFQAVEDGKVPAQEMADAEQMVANLAGPGQGATAWNDPVEVRAHRARFLRHMTRLVEICKLPDHQQAGPLARLGEDLPRQPTFLRLQCQGSHRMPQRCWRYRAELRSAAVAMAVERYRQANGHWPPSLVALVPRQLREVPIDPHDGKPLRYRQNGDGIVIYSVGPDLSDDGGLIDRSNPYRQGTDQGFRLWEPNLRRQGPTAAQPEK